MIEEIDRLYLFLKRQPFEKISDVIFDEIVQRYRQYKVLNGCDMPDEAHLELIARVCLENHWHPCEFYRTYFESQGNDMDK